MKLTLIALALFASTAFAQTATIGQIFKTVTSAGTPLQVSSSDLIVRHACFQCSFANTGTSCYVGTSVTKAVAALGVAMSKPTATAVAQPFCIGSLSSNAGPGINLKNIWVDVATSNDEVNVIYTE